MRKIFFALAVLSLTAGCTMGSVTSAPAPLTHTVIDERALTLAAQTVDVLALSATALVKNHIIVAGSPTAVRLANALDKARNGVKAASAARDAGNATTYGEALAKASQAVAEIRSIISPGT